MESFEMNPLEAYTTIFKALSDMTRFKIMWLLLSIDSKISVSEIIDVLEESQYNVSKHLRILKNANLIHEKKEGKWSFYYYTPRDDMFHKNLRGTVMALPREIMGEAISRCEKRLSMRVDGKCVLGAESDEWVEIIHEQIK